MTEQVRFFEPTSRNDLRVVLANTTHEDTGYHAVVYVTQYGERRTLPWLTKTEADRRAVALRKRGYRVVCGPMD